MSWLEFVNVTEATVILEKGHQLRRCIHVVGLWSTLLWAVPSLGVGAQAMEYRQLAQHPREPSQEAASLCGLSLFLPPRSFFKFLTWLPPILGYTL